MLPAPCLDGGAVSSSRPDTHACVAGCGGSKESLFKVLRAEYPKGVDAVPGPAPPIRAENSVRAWRVSPGWSA